MPDRRDFLKGACGVAALALGPVLLADQASAADGISRKPNGQVVVEVARIPALAKVGGVVNLGNVKGVPVAVVRTGPSSYRALDLRCTHQGTPVRKTGEMWTCPSHGSQFAIGGAFLRGPAGRALNTVRSSLNKKVLTIG